MYEADPELYNNRLWMCVCIAAATETTGGDQAGQDDHQQDCRREADAHVLGRRPHVRR